MKYEYDSEAKFLMICFPLKFRHWDIDSTSYDYNTHHVLRGPENEKASAFHDCG